MKLIVILVVVAVLLLGGGGAIYFFRDAVFGGGESAETAAKLPISKTPDALFVNIETLNVTVIRNRRVDKHILLQVTLEVANEEARVLVSKTLPRIKDAFIREMYDYYAILPPNQRGINVEVIKKRLKRAADRVMGDDSIKNVLIQGAVERESGQPAENKEDKKKKNGSGGK